MCWSYTFLHTHQHFFNNKKLQNSCHSKISKIKKENGDFIFFLVISKLEGKLEWCAWTRRAPDEAVLVAGGTTLEAILLSVQLVAATTLDTQNKPVPSARVTDARFLCGQAFHELLELAGLVQRSHLVGPTYVPPTNENPRQSQLSVLTQYLLQLG